MLGHNKIIVRAEKTYIIFSYSFIHLKIYYCHIIFNSIRMKEKIQFQRGNFYAFYSLLVFLKLRSIFYTKTAL
jgi:hypothetical protein